jgi:F-type H+-transporting ATPase subunit delta
MTSRAAAKRYARALLEVSVREADPQQVERELAEFAAALTDDAGVWKLLLNPAVPAPRSHAVLAELAGRAGLAPVLQRTVVMLAARDRLALLPDLVERYREQLMDHLQVVRAEVTTAMPLSPDRARAIEQSLAAATGKRVTVATRVDPAIVGGVVARIGGTVYDGSIARHLERIKEQLTGVNV